MAGPSRQVWRWLARQHFHFQPSLVSLRGTKNPQTQTWWGQVTRMACGVRRNISWVPPCC